MLVVALATASGWKIATFRGLIAVGVVGITWQFGFYVFTHSLFRRSGDDDTNQSGGAELKFGIARKPSATDEEFRPALSSLLEMLVPVVRIPGFPIPRVPVSVRDWDDREIQLLIQNVEPEGYVLGWQNHEVDNRQRENALAILKYLEEHERVHHNLAIITPKKEYRSLRKAAIATSDAYRQTLKARAEENWLNGTSYGGKRIKRYYRALDTRRKWDYQTFTRATRLIFELREHDYGIEVPSGLEFIADEIHRDILGTSV